MEIFYTCGLALLEMTFIFVGLLILHGLRKIIGSAGFYIALGLLLVFTQVVSASGLRVTTGLQGVDFSIASCVLFLPYLSLLMVVYVAEGTLVAQRMIIGAMATLGLYVYLSGITSIQCTWPGYSISQGASADQLDYLLRQSQRSMAAMTLSQALDLFLIPIFFQRLKNIKCRMFVCVLGALMLTQIVDSVVYVTACYWGQAQWGSMLTSSYISKAVATLWLAILANVYLTRIETEKPGESRRTLDIIFAFFGSYGRARSLEQNLRESEERYRLVVRNASDMIILLNREGIIVDANIAAVKNLGRTETTELVGRRFEEVARTKDGSKIPWESYGREIPAFKPDETSGPQMLHRLQCVVTPLAEGSEELELDLVFSGIFVGETPIVMAFGRDITEQQRLEREKEEWRAQAAHGQRLEAIGRLAGGIAHDFNNYIHAIQGHLDILKYMHEIKDDDVRRHLDKIDSISEQAGRLTSQLLGFARKGKYHEKIIDIAVLVKRSAELFLPNARAEMGFRVDAGRRKFFVKGDPVQLQQVLLNLLINARDAMDKRPESERSLVVSIGLPESFSIELAPPPELKERKANYCCIRIQDNGTGIEPQAMSRIFEPFFTTKPTGKGTGMGLAMAYGTILSHNGWIQVQSYVGIGTAFHLILPIWEDGVSGQLQVETDTRSIPMFKK